MAILRTIFGDDIPEPHTAIISKWNRDPLFRCAYTGFGPVVPEEVFDDLLTPVNECLYFAGEGLNHTHYGYTHGGYGSGAYVVKNVSDKISASGPDPTSIASQPGSMPTNSSELVMESVAMMMLGLLFQDLY